MVEEEASAVLPVGAAPLLMSKYERARLVSARVVELESNAAPTVETEPGDTLFDIAAREVDGRTLDMELRRFLPNGRHQLLRLSCFPHD